MKMKIPALQRIHPSSRQIVIFLPTFLGGLFYFILFYFLSYEWPRTEETDNLK